MYICGCGRCLFRSLCSATDLSRNPQFYHVCIMTFKPIRIFNCSHRIINQPVIISTEEIVSQLPLAVMEPLLILSVSRFMT